MEIPRSLMCLVIVSLGLSACGDEKGSGGSPPAKPQIMRDALRDGGEGPPWLAIPAGKGIVGDDTGVGDSSERPVKKVVASRPFGMSVTEITFADYDRFCKAVGQPCPDDKGWGRGKQPVINVSWTDAVAYTQWLSEQTGHTYRLPSEAEWEYAARGGSTTRYWWKEKYIQGKDHCDMEIGGCPAGIDAFNPGAVGRFQPNPFGLMDVTSNVHEWVLDCWTPTHDKSKTDLSVVAGGDCDARVIKGGAYYMKASYLRMSLRIEGIDYQTSRSGSTGIRVLREL